MKKRWISLLLVLALVLAVWSVCAVAADAQKSDETAEETAAAEPAEEAVEEAPAEEPAISCRGPSRRSARAEPLTGEASRLCWSGGRLRMSAAA